MHEIIEFIVGFWGRYSTAVMIGISASISIFLAWMGFLSDRRIAAHRATLDFILKYNIHSKEWKDNFFVCRSVLRKTDEDLDQFIDAPMTEEKQEKLQKTLTVLNNFEVAALGIRDKIIDKNLYEEWFRYVIVSKWRLASRFVTKFRAHVKERRLYVQFEKLAKEWMLAKDLSRDEAKYARRRFSWILGEETPDISNAQTLQLGTPPIEVNLANGGPRIFRVVIPAVGSAHRPDTYRIEATSESVDPIVFLWSAKSDNELAYVNCDDDSGNVRANALMKVPMPAGTYFIGVDEFQGRVGKCAVSIKVESP